LNVLQIISYLKILELSRKLTRSLFAAQKLLFISTRFYLIIECTHFWNQFKEMSTDMSMNSQISLAFGKVHHSKISIYTIISLDKFMKDGFKHEYLYNP